MARINSCPHQTAEDAPVGTQSHPSFALAQRQAQNRRYNRGMKTSKPSPSLSCPRHTGAARRAVGGIAPEYRGSGGTAILYSEMFKSVSESRRYRHAEVVQIGMENKNMQREMENFGIDFYKMHRTYERNL
jgi:hypothetical protein